MRHLLQVLRSKTVWTAITVAAFTAASEDLKDWMSDNPGYVGYLASFLLIFLRSVTFGPLFRRGDGVCPHCGK